jgi:uncharacterized membrane protein YfcA
MDGQVLLMLMAGFFCVAALYTSVGHAGASGYLALMALAGVMPETMRPTALLLNILVASLTVYRFHHAGRLAWRGLWPFLLGSVPMAVFGGALRLPHAAYYALVGLVLVCAAGALLLRAFREQPDGAETPVRVRVAGAVAMGAVIGLLSGLTGTGGGIFLSPAILFLGWAGPRGTAGVAAPFILVNSGVALAAGSLRVQALPAELPALALAALGGALLGSWLALRRLSRRGLLVALAGVEMLASAKLFLAALA